MTSDHRELFWYHTFDFGDAGVTKGLFDHRTVVDKLPLPKDLTGKRCLDVAASDGFFGFEMAKRGATEVISLDLEDKSLEDTRRPDGAASRENQAAGRPTKCFEFARDRLDLRQVTRVDMSLYDMTAEELGTFDFVFMGNVLLHLSDPVKAVQACRRVTATDGQFLSFETVVLGLSLLTRRPAASFFSAARSGDGARNDLNRFWTPNVAAHREMVRAGGFSIVDKTGLLFQPLGRHRQRFPRAVPRNVRQLHYWTVVRQLGIPSAAVLARPA